jgi:hypothetical protein
MCRQALRLGFGVPSVELEACLAQPVASMPSPTVTVVRAQRVGGGHAAGLVVLERSMHLLDPNACAPMNAYRAAGEFPGDTWRRLQIRFDLLHSGKGLRLEPDGRGALTPAGYAFRTAAGYAMQVPGGKLTVSDLQRTWHSLGVNQASHSLDKSGSPLQQVGGTLALASAFAGDTDDASDALATVRFASCACALLWRLREGGPCSAVCLEVRPEKLTVHLLQKGRQTCNMRLGVHREATPNLEAFSAVLSGLQQALNNGTCAPADGHFVLLDPEQSAAPAIAELRLPSSEPRREGLRGVLLDALLPVSRPAHPSHLLFASGVLDVAQEHVPVPAMTCAKAIALVRAVLELPPTKQAPPAAGAPLAGGFAVFWRMLPQGRGPGAPIVTSMLVRVSPAEPPQMWAKRDDAQEPTALHSAPDEVPGMRVDAAECAVTDAELLVPVHASGLGLLSQAKKAVDARGASVDDPFRALFAALSECLNAGEGS